MEILICAKPQNITLEEWRQDYASLPLWRKHKVDSYRFFIDKVLCTKAYTLLAEGLRQLYGIDRELEFIYTPKGKPLLKDYPDIHFNLSHCPCGVLCAIDTKPVGCDIEKIGELPEDDVLRYCFNDSEIYSILSSELPAVEFTKYWTIKEAILKLNGEGISEDLPSLLQAPGIILPQTVVELDNSFVYSVL